MKLRRLYESVKLKNKKAAFQILYNSAANFIYNKLSLQTNINITFKNSSSNNSFGHFDFKNNIVVEDSSPNLVIKHIAHELTHVRQMESGDLIVKGQYIIWKDNEKFLLSDYASNKNYNVHSKWPWEVEAYKNENGLANLYLKSTEFIQTMNSDPTLKYLLDNGLFP